MANPIVIDENALEELYGDLADATQAAARGDTNECASKAADAKEHLLELHDNATTLEEIDVLDD